MACSVSRVLRLNINEDSPATVTRWLQAPVHVPNAPIDVI